MREGAPQPKRHPDGTLLSSMDFGEEDPHEFLLSRYVVNRRGKKVGESIGVEKSHIILKHGKKFYSIPFDKIQEKGADLLLKGKVDWTIAGAKGERWRKKSFDMIAPISGTGPPASKRTQKTPSSKQPGKAPKNGRSGPPGGSTKKGPKRAPKKNGAQRREKVKSK